MFTRIAAITLLAAGCSATAGPRPADPLPTVPPPGAVEPEPIEAGQKPAPGEYAAGFDAVQYEIAVDLADATATPPRIDARTRVTVAIEPPRRDTLVLDFSGLRVLAVQAGSDAAAMGDVAYRHADGRLHVALPSGARAGDTIMVDVRYDGTPDDGLIIRDNVHGERTAFVDNWPNRARFWFPSIDHPGDKARVVLAVRAPRGWSVVANGPRRNVPPGSDPLVPPADGVWSFAIDEPIPTYTMVFGAGELTQTTLDACVRFASRCIPTRLYTFPQDSAKAQPSFARAAQMLAFYSDLFGEFPYDKLDHVQSATQFGGMENVGAIFYSEKSIAEGNDIEGTVAHEIVHQWFGDAVTEDNWQHLWLSEGFATYFASVFFEHEDGDAAFMERIADDVADYLASGDAALPLVDTTATLVPDLFALLNTNSYQKGGLVLHMLRELLGDAAFFEGVRNYYNAHLHGTALSDDLRFALERASGRDLSWFFDQWVYSPGHPVLRVSQDYDAAARQAVITIEQVQDPAWPTFRFDTEVRLRTGSGVARGEVTVTERTTTLRVPMPAAPTSLELIPRGWLLREMAN